MADGAAEAIEATEPEETAREIFPVSFYKNDAPAGPKDFAIRQLPADLVESEGDDDPKDLSATESALSSEQTPSESGEKPASVEKDLAPTNTEDSKPTSSSTPTTSPGKLTPPVVVPTPNSGSPSAAKSPVATKPSASASGVPSA